MGTGANPPRPFVRKLASERRGPRGGEREAAGRNPERRGLLDVLAQALLQALVGAVVEGLHRIGRDALELGPVGLSGGRVGGAPQEDLAVLGRLQGLVLGFVVLF